MLYYVCISYKVRIAVFRRLKAKEGISKKDNSKREKEELFIKLYS